MQFFKRVEQLVGPIEYFCDREWLLSEFQQLCEIVTRHELHHEKLSFAMREVIRYSRQRRMSQVRQQLGFAPKRAPLFFGNRESLFDCDDATEAFVHRLIDCAHPAVAKLVNDAIALTENCVGGKHVSNYSKGSGRF